MMPLSVQRIANATATIAGAIFACKSLEEQDMGGIFITLTVCATNAHTDITTHSAQTIEESSSKTKNPLCLWILDMIEIYVDGSAINNENPNIPTLGGVGVVVLGSIPGQEPDDYHLTVENHVLSRNGLELGKTTNNTTELAAIWVALGVIRYYRAEGEDVPAAKIYGDSQYAGNLVFGNWKPKENKELVAKVKRLASEVPNVTWEYVKAHADNQYNNYADYLARSGAYKAPQEEVLSFNEWLSGWQI